MIKEDLMLIIFFILGAIFVIFGILKGILIRKLRNLLREKYPKIHKSIFLGIGPLFIYRPIKLFKYLNFTNSYPKEVFTLVHRIKLFSKLTWLFFILTILSLFIVEILF